jgi:murein DD-endopeptidase MepM/ murein hydrolase activator NlpD
MRARATDSRGWSTSRKGRIGSRFILLLFVLSSMGGLFTSATPGAVRADELEDAYQRQERLQNLIDRQKESIRNLTANQAVLASKISSTKSTLAQLNANLLVTKTQIVGMTVDIARSQNAVDELVATGAVLEAELVRLEVEAARKELELAAAKALLAARIREAYDTDRTPMLTTFLSGDDFTDVLTEVGYQLDFAEQDKLLADQIAQDRKTLAVLHENVELAKQQTIELHALAAESKATLDKQLKELKDARAELARLEAETAKLLRAEQAAYAKLAANKAELAAKLRAEQEAAAKLEKLIARLVAEQIAKGGIPSQYSGTFQWPMRGRITQEFGCTGFYLEPRVGSCAHFHRGIDIGARMYTPIYAAGPGKVVFAGKSPSSSLWYVVIAHSKHLISWYGHVDNGGHRPVVRAGQFVSKGQLIAYNGMTGMTTGPHLHWGVQIDGNWVNPRLFLPR